MKVLLSLVVAAVAFGVAVGQSSTTDMPRKPPGPPMLMKYVHNLMMMNCLCEDEAADCTMLETYNNCVRDDLIYAGNITAMSPCDVQRKIQERQDFCFGENGVLMEPVKKCMEKHRKMKEEIMGEPRDRVRGRFGPPRDPCMPDGGSQEAS